VATAKPKVVEKASVENVGTDVVVSFDKDRFVLDGQQFVALIADSRVAATGVIR